MGRWKNPNYWNEYHEAHKEKIDEQIQQYHKAFVKRERLKYLGVMDCPKCGLKGYGWVVRQVNVKTGSEYPPYLEVRHQHTEHNKTVYDGQCIPSKGEFNVTI